MRNLYRRMEALEKATAARRTARHAVLDRALGWLSQPDLELLISACGAERQWRPLSRDEWAARQAYLSAVERQCQWAGLGRPSAAACTPDVRHAILLVLVRTISTADFELLGSASRAAQQGRPPTEPELAAMQVYAAEVERLSQRAGLASRTEFENLFSSQSTAGGNR